MPKDEGQPLLQFSLDQIGTQLEILFDNNTARLVRAKTLHEQLGISSGDDIAQPATAQAVSAPYTYL